MQSHQQFHLQIHTAYIVAQSLCIQTNLKYSSLIECYILRDFTARARREHHLRIKRYPRAGTYGIIVHVVRCIVQEFLHIQPAGKDHHDRDSNDHVCDRTYEHVHPAGVEPAKTTLEA